MGKAFGILLIVTAIWAGLELYTEGTGGAFGGALASLSGEEPAAEGVEVERRSTVERAGDAVSRSYRQMEERYDSQLGD